MANTGGGVIVYGIRESSENKDQAGTRSSAGSTGPEFEQAVLQLAYGSIAPPLNGLEFHRVDEGRENNALVLVVPASRQAPHMYFVEKKDKRTLAVPVRNGAYSEWLTEPEIARLYRQRFEAQGRADEQLQVLFERTIQLRADEGYWMAGVAYPASSVIGFKREAVAIRKVALAAKDHAIRRQYDGGITPLTASYQSCRRGFRSWRFAEDRDRERPETYVEFHDDGAISVLCRLDEAVAGSGTSSISSYRLAVVAGDLLALMAEYSQLTGVREYDVRIGMEWTGARSLEIIAPKDIRFFDEKPLPITHFIPVTVTVDVSDPETLLDSARSLALDCLNQAGITRLTVFDS
ncbi:ATP-binding protein [Corynebacterium singulare]|uniref:ATP-binding protein n=2 Tax=Corynebacterium singulare TaxID=161899 RepID=A0ABS9PY80_9CORY|nr:ATP-binding protein [Corynebacterium singulare]